MFYPAISSLDKFVFPHIFWNDLLNRMFSQAKARAPRRTGSWVRTRQIRCVACPPAATQMFTNNRETLGCSSEDPGSCRSPKQETKEKGKRPGVEKVWIHRPRHYEDDSGTETGEEKARRSLKHYTRSFNSSYFVTRNWTWRKSFYQVRQSSFEVSRFWLLSEK